MPPAHASAAGPPPHPHPHAAPYPGAFPMDAAQVGALLPDLSFASSEDLLRSLQDFDISKVVTVLKTLGEAAAAANVQLNAPPMFAPAPPPPAAQQQQQPVRSEAILGRPPKTKRGRGAAAGTAAGAAAPAPLQHDNPDHAHMLANVWMNAAKLAELVKSEGRCAACGPSVARGWADAESRFARVRVQGWCTRRANFRRRRRCS